MCVHSFDHCPVAIDLPVVVFVLVVQAAVSGFPDRVRAVPADAALIGGGVPGLPGGVGKLKIPGYTAGRARTRVSGRRPTSGVRRDHRRPGG